MSSPTAVLLNDTRGEAHFGCLRVMRSIDEQLQARGIQVSARAGVRADWASDAAFVRALGACDLVLINGEGTLHHGARAGAQLLKVVDHPARGSKPVALVNALYQANPAHWAGWLERMALVSARDSWSAAEASAHAGQPVGFVPDLSLAASDAATPAPATARRGMLVGDSVARDTSAALRALAETLPDARRIAIRTTLKPPKPHQPAPLRALRQAYIRLHAAAAQRRDARLRLCRDEAAFLDALRGTRLHVTGRFHAVCLCLVTRTPFLAVDSNSWKIAALLHDLGLGAERLVALDDLPAHAADPHWQQWHGDEAQRIDSALAQCRAQTAALFDRLAALARGAGA